MKPKTSAGSSKNISNNFNLPFKTIDNEKNFAAWVVMENAYNAIYRSRVLEVAQFGLTQEQAKVLSTILIYGGSATMNQISTFTNRKPNSVSVIINRMNKMGLVSKNKHPKQNLVISITEKGRKIYKKISIESINLIFSVLSAKEKQQFVITLLKLEGKARDLLGIDYRPPFLIPSHDTIPMIDLQNL